ncbi:MAG: DnaJ domain-containing protein [Hyphomicrobiales bacterium]|nr:DnaJ domain-containing protein [Hyphomicrobiales bacterium]
MAADPYQILGVGKSASQADIQKAYRKLAKKLHPDLNPGDKKVEEQFKELSAAYDIVGDPAKRARFDAGEIDASGMEKPQPRQYYRDFADQASPYAREEVYEDFDGDEFAELLRRARASRANMRGQDTHFRLKLNFLDAVNGATQQIIMTDGAPIDLKIPAGARDGQIMRLRGKGEPGLGKGPPGDALIELEVAPHPLFTRKDDDIHVELPLGLREAVLGGEIRVPTTTGDVMMRVPKWTNTGATLRLRGKGVARADGTKGDELVTLKLRLPDKADADLEHFMQGWSGHSRQTTGA